MSKFLKLAAVALATIPTALAGNLVVHNGCGFDIWCSGAKNDGNFSPLVVVGGNGGVFFSPLIAENDNIGSVLKCSTSNGGQVFQLELTVQDGRSWMDLSALDGDPFFSFHRHAEISGQCVVDCPAGTTVCEWPVQVDCFTAEDSWLSLC
ncbi:hypothetical protein F5Y04DRAFT_280999 [Hypomontagnella monticulosa]|nr:hypothetical protein F5Y04DRAFT_280999 [Hypomontagnella monticulosa]